MPKISDLWAQQDTPPVGPPPSPMAVPGTRDARVAGIPTSRCGTGRAAGRVCPEVQKLVFLT